MSNELSTPPSSAKKLIMPTSTASLPPRFPIEELPTQFFKPIKGVQSEMDLPLEYFGGSALAVMSYYVGNRFLLKINNTYYVPAPLYIALVGPSSDGKTPAMGFMLSPIWQQQREFREVGSKMSVIVKNATVESLTPILQKNPFGVLYAPDELSELLQGMNQYKGGGKGNDDAFFLDVWNNTFLASDRIGRGRTYVERPFMSIVGGLQYERLSTLAKGDNLRSGFLNRFLFCLSPSKKMTRTKNTSIDNEWKERYIEMCHCLENIPSMIQMPINDEERDAKIKSYFLNLNEKAFTIYSEFEDKWKTYAEECGFPIIREGIGKLCHYALRIALILHVCDTTLYYSDDLSLWNLNEENTISETTIKRAIRITEYFINNFERVIDKVQGGAQDIGSFKIWQRILYANLPEDDIFKRADALKILEEINEEQKISITERTLFRFLSQPEIFTKISSGKYRKR